ncbi:MAG: TetR/AcrR family transcriptional regulator [Burkholderiaceae bacterium]|nr:TetR/AcrR family transcriptional regulator [Burkholderiaceae bacterium]
MSPPATSKAPTRTPGHAPVHAGGGPRRWARRKDARPGELLEAALALFVDRGFAATRLEDVARRAGVSKGTLYLYYANKEELLKAVVRANLIPLIDSFAAEIQDSGAPCADQLRLFFRKWWETVGATRYAGIAKLVVAESGNFPELARFFQEEVILPVMAVLASIVRRGIELREFREIDVDASVPLWMSPLVLRAIWEHSITPCCPPNFDIPIERFLETHLRYVLCSLSTEG